jgi:hypothetical protein
MMDKRGKLSKYRHKQHKEQQLKKDNQGNTIDMIIEDLENAGSSKEE